MSARRSADVEQLKETIRGFFKEILAEAELFLGWGAQQHRGKLFASCEVLEERADEDGATFRVRGVPEVIAGLQKQFGPPPKASMPAKAKPVVGKSVARKSATKKSASTRSEAAASRTPRRIRTKKESG